MMRGGWRRNFFLFRSDGASLGIDVLDHQLQVLFDAGFVRESENWTLISREEDKKFPPDVVVHTYAVENERCVVNIVHKFVKDSYTVFPINDSGGTIDNPSREEGVPLCDETTVLANCGGDITT